MRYGWFVIVCLFVLLLAGCAVEDKACPPDSIMYVDEMPAEPPPAAAPAPVEMRIGAATVQVDRVIEGALCNDTLSGTVYIGCSLQIKPWQEQPNFLDGCNFTVQPGTVVYVAAHNDSAYYNGCVSCHASKSAAP